MFEQIETLPFWLKAVVIFFTSFWKSYSGPILSALSGFSFIEMLLINLSGAFLSMFFVYHFRTQVLNLIFRTKTKSGFNARLRKILKLWRKYGFIGTIALSPILIGIPTGVLISAHFKTEKKILFSAMMFSAFLWMCLFYLITKFGVDISTYFFSAFNTI